MSEHHFGSGRGKVSSAKAKKINRIARKHGYHFVAADMPEGPRFWFSGPNYGAPFDRAAETAIWDDLKRAGLADEDGIA